jgi:hypothetical protein
MVLYPSGDLPASSFRDSLPSLSTGSDIGLSKKLLEGVNYENGFVIIYSRNCQMIGAKKDMIKKKEENLTDEILTPYLKTA